MKFERGLLIAVFVLEFEDPTIGLTQKISELEAKVKELSLTRDTLLKELAASEEDDEAKDAKIDSLEKALREHAGKAPVVVDNPEALEAATAPLKSKIEEQHSFISSLKDQLSQIQSESKISREELERSTEEKSREFEARLATLQAEARDLEIQKKESENALKEQQRLLDSEREKADAQSSAVTRAQAETENLNQQLVDLRQQVNDNKTGNEQEKKAQAEGFTVQIQVRFSLLTLI